MAKEFIPPDGLPGHQELKHRRLEAEGVLKGRGIATQVNPPTLMLNALIRLVRSRLEVSDAEWDYFGELVSVEGLEQVIEATQPKPVIHLAGIKGGRPS